MIWKTEAVVRRCSVKNVFLESSQNSQENTCARDAFLIIEKESLEQMFSCEFCEISKNSLFNRTPQLADSWKIKKILQLKLPVSKKLPQQHTGALFWRLVKETWTDLQKCEIVVDNHKMRDSQNVLAKCFNFAKIIT